MTTCPGCASPHLVPRRVYRRGALAVFLGHLLLLPAVGVLALGTMGVVASRPAEPDPVDALALVSDLRAHDVPAAVVERVASCQEIAAAELDRLDGEQRALVLRAQASTASGRTRSSIARLLEGDGPRIAGACALLLAVAGALLVQKRGALACTNCGTVAAG